MVDKRHSDGTTKGGQELPADVQDRPEQNAGYDDAVRGAGPADETADEAIDEDDEFEDDEDSEEETDEEEEGG